MTYKLSYLNDPYFIVSILNYYFDMQSYILRIPYTIQNMLKDHIGVTGTS